MSNENLTILQGSTRSFIINLVNENDIAEDLSAVDKAVFAMKEAVSDTTDLLNRNTDDSNITVGASSITCSLTAEEADDLLPGTYIAQVFLRFGSESLWFATDPFKVVVVAAIAARI